VRRSKEDPLDRVPALERPRRELGSTPTAWRECYSRLLERHPKQVYFQLQRWNKTDDEWLRRLSLVSLIHYTGKNAVFLPPEKVLPLVENCLNDNRYFLQKAVGWVLREMEHVYPDLIRSFIKEHAARMGSIEFSRSIERLDAEQRKAL